MVKTIQGMISRDLTSKFHAYGYLALPELWSDRECDLLVEASTSLPSYTDGTMTPSMQPHRIRPTFLDALKSKPVVDLVEEILEGRASGIQTEFFFCRTGTPGYTNHQDNYYVRADSNRFVSVWVTLVDDVAADSGCLVAYPGSQREGLLPVRHLHEGAAPGQDPNARKIETIVPPWYQPLDLAAPRRGTAIFIHGDLVHGSHPNRRLGFDRNVILMTYVAQGSPFRPGLYAKRAEVNLHDE